MRAIGYDCDVLVVGGGIVGLATAYAITRAAPGTRVTVLEKEQGPARHQTGRNSGVIHSGIYYRPGSLKAQYAVSGAAEMVKFCAEYGIAHAVTGKLIVATEREELPRLHALVQRGRENGIPVRELRAGQIAEYEPQVQGLAAIHVGTTGVCDFVGVARQLAEGSGAEIRYGARVERVDRRADLGVAVRTEGGDIVRGRVLVNCAGLYCDEVARMTGDEPEVRIVPFRGSTTPWRGPSWCGGWCIRCRIRRFRSSGCISRAGSTGACTSGRTLCRRWPGKGTGGVSCGRGRSGRRWRGPGCGGWLGGTGGTAWGSCGGRCPRGRSPWRCGGCCRP